MNRHHTIGAALFSVLLILTGIFTIRENSFGKTGSSAFVPSTVEVDDVAEAVEEAIDEEVIEEEPAVSDMIAEVLANPQKVTPLPPEKIDSETLWLARVIYSETKRPEEMELVAWVVRNRVETRYRGKASYQATVLDPFQFSAFNPGDRKREHYSSLTTRSNAPGFNNAISIAFSVRHADDQYRPFQKTTRHFYSERSMVGVKHPNWARDGRKVNPKRNFTLDERRFRFFADVS